MFAAWILVSLLAVPSDIVIDVGQTGVTFSVPWPATVVARDGDELNARQVSSHMAVFLVGEAERIAAEPLLGEYHRAANRLVFTPRFRLAAGLLYRVRYVDGDGNVLHRDFRSPRSEAPSSTRVEQVFPSDELLPANLLKFYLHFSAPMREGREVFERIVLLSERGEEVPAPWRPTELWTADARRLTLWIHPGRIKEGVDLRAAEGPVLEPGQRYTLVVTRRLLDAAGAPLAEEFRKSFLVGPVDHEMPALSRWEISPPADDQQPLTVLFSKPLDRHLAARCLEVIGPTGLSIAGKVEISNRERTWTFHPHQPWQAGDYQLAAEEILEDLAGNTPTKPFEVNLAAPVAARPLLKWPFQIRATK